MTAARRGQRVIVVVLDSTTRPLRDAKAAELTAKGFALLSTGAPRTAPTPARKAWQQNWAAVNNFFLKSGGLDSLCPTTGRQDGKKELLPLMRDCPRVTLEPELECEVALFTPSQRIELARKFERWARQLKVSAFILRRDAGAEEACCS